MYLYKLLYLVYLNSVCDAYRILLVFPVPGRSHSILGEGYVRHLLKDGHEVTYVTPIPIKNPHPKLKQIDVSMNSEFISTGFSFDIRAVFYNEIDLKDTSLKLSYMRLYANVIIMHPKVQKFINNTNEHFDAVIVEWLYTELYCGFAAVFNCPLIWSSSMEPHPMILELIDEPPNPAYYPDHRSDYIPPFTFCERAVELWNMLSLHIYKWWKSDVEREIFNAAYGPAISKRGRTVPEYIEVKYNASLMLGNSNSVSGSSIRLPQNYINIGGYHLNDEIEPLPKDLQNIMDNASNGVIYFSMGSMMRASRIPDDIKKGLFKMFGNMNQTVIWKFEEKLSDIPKNVHILEWVPQQSILAHPNCVLFITHGGILSITETLHFGVPIIGIPIYGDQHLNINRAVSKGFGKRIDFNEDIVDRMKSAIEEIIYVPSYRQKVKELSYIYRDRLKTPGEELVHWVRHVIHSKGAPHLRSPTFLVSWYQKIYLDLLFLLILIFYVLLRFLKVIMGKNNNSITKKKLL